MPADPLRPSFWVRIAALLIDYALILGWMAVLAAVTLSVAAITGPHDLVAGTRVMRALPAQRPGTDSAGSVGRRRHVPSPEPRRGGRSGPVAR